MHRTLFVLNKLPIPNKYLLNDVLRLAREVFDHKTENGFDKERSVAPMVHFWITKTPSKIGKVIKNYPMLEYIIRNYHRLNESSSAAGEIYFDTDQLAFQTKTNKNPSVETTGNPAIPTIIA